MRMLNFAKRNFKELIRDPLSLLFEFVLPIFLLFIFQQINIPGNEYKLENFTPSIILFGFSFITLFTATLVAKDRDTSLLVRLGVSPMRPVDYILGYVLAILPIVIIQNVLFFVMALVLGLSFSITIIYTILVSIFISIFFISLGILIGSIVSEKASGGVGSIIVQLVCFTSGMYFSNELIGKTFQFICKVLPFESCLKIIKGVLNKDWEIISLRNIFVFSAYALVALVLSMYVFNKKMVDSKK